MFEYIINAKLASADIVAGRGQPGDPVVVNPRFYRRVALGGALALGESYVDGDWECADLDVLVHKMITSGITEPSFFRSLLTTVSDVFRRTADPAAARRLGEHHYSLGNDLYRAMLGPTMVYTCAFWTPTADTLDAAQEAKLEMVCRKLKLERGMSVLDIGCGWGSFLKYAAEHYGTVGTGITVSQEQATLARERCIGLPVTIQLCDYRESSGTFDRVVSLGMFEHVERSFSRQFMQVFHDRMQPGGIGLLHTIGKDRPSETNPWIRKYIFTLGDIPTHERMVQAAEGLLQEQHWHVLGSEHYDGTLMAWHENFRDAWDDLKARYDNRFWRMWRFYLLGCAGVFRARELNVWQMMYTRAGEHVPFVLPQF